MFRSHILVCGGTGCTSGNSMKIYEALVDRIQKEGLEKEVHVTKTGCFGLCAYGPIMIVYPEGAFYSQVKVEDNTVTLWLKEAVGGKNTITYEVADPQWFYNDFNDLIV